MKSSFFALIIVVLSLIIIGIPVFADVPQLLNYQGRLTDTNGDPLNGSYSIQFLIFNAPTVGSAIWSETHGTVNISEGVYQVLLGSITPFAQDLFTSSVDRYLEIIVAGETLTPRTRFTSVTYALKTAHSDSSDFATTAATSVTAGSAAPTGTATGDLAGSYPSPTVDGIRGRTVSATAPTTDQVLKWNGSAWAPAADIAGGGSVWTTSGSNIYFNTGNVGIGNTNPTTPLHVTGTVTATTFAGSGASLTALNASNLSTGTLPTARFSGTYSSAVTLSNASNSFTGIGSGLTALNASNISIGTIGSAYLPTTLQPNRVIASDYITADGGMHVGSSTDPGTDNLIVDGQTSIGTSNLGYPLTVYSGTAYDRALFIDHNGHPTAETHALQIDHDNSGSGYTHGALINVNNTNTGSGWTYGLRSEATNDGGTAGVYGIQSTANGTSSNIKYALWGSAYGSGDCIGVDGNAAGSAVNYGGYFTASGGTEDFGIWASADKHYFESSLALTNNNILASEYAGIAINTDVRAVYGNGTTNPGYGIGGYFEGGYRAVWAYVPSTTSTSSCYALYANAQGSAGRRYGVSAAAGGTGTDYSYAFYGSASSGATYPYGIYATCGSSTGNYGGYFIGNLHSTGSNTESMGGTKIDHPLDPENKYLMHSNVASPDMMNVYNGNVILDNQGEALVELPEYFEVLNKDFRYQLTCIGGFAQVYIAEKISNNRFKIAGGKSALEVSWQVTGVRHDPVAEKNRIVVEVNKDDRERGLYQNPEAYNVPSTMSIETIHATEDDKDRN